MEMFNWRKYILGEISLLHYTLKNSVTGYNWTLTLKMLVSEVTNQLLKGQVSSNAVETTFYKGKERIVVHTISFNNRP